LEERDEFQILTDAGTYEERTYRNEHELERLAVSHSKELFGNSTLYFDLKQKVTGKLRPRITDGLLLDLTDSKQPRFFIVEYELSNHDMENTVAPQLRNFTKKLRDEQALAEIRDAIYKEIMSNSEKRKQIRDFLKTDLGARASGEEPDIHFVLNNILHQQTGVLVVIDRVDEDIIEALGDFSATIIEFRTFAKDGKLIHMAKPLHPSSFSTEIGRRVGRKLVQTRKSSRQSLPEYRRSWEARLEWVSPTTREFTSKVIQMIASELPGVLHGPNYKWYAFYTKQPLTERNRIAVILMGKNVLRLAFRVNPGKFSDPSNLSNSVEGWFFPQGTERRAPVTPENLESVVSLVKSAIKQLN